jgi:signal transduction histidine kinase
MKATDQFSHGQFQQKIDSAGTDELGQLTKSFNNMAEKLEFNEVQRRRLFADVTHELRTPLSVIQATIEGMTDGVIELNKKELFRALDQTKTLNRIIEDLRLLSLAESKQLELKKENINIEQLVNEVIEDLTPIAEESGCKLIFGTTLKPKIVTVDQHRIKQVLSNLIINALKQINREDIKIDISNNSKFCIISVSDSGPGVSNEDQKHIFDRFYRIDESRSRTSGGTGLGLAIVKSLVEAHDGNIYVKSTASDGATFSFEIPLKS